MQNYKLVLSIVFLFIHRTRVISCPFLSMKNMFYSCHLSVITFTTQVDFSLMFILGSIPVFFSFIVVAILTHYNDWDPAWALIKRLYYCFHRLTCLFCTICFICRRKTPHVRYAPSYTPPPSPSPSPLYSYRIVFSVGSMQCKYWYLLIKQYIAFTELSVSRSLLKDTDIWRIFVYYYYYYMSSSTKFKNEALLCKGLLSNHGYSFMFYQGPRKSSSYLYLQHLPAQYFVFKSQQCHFYIILTIESFSVVVHI